MCVCYTRAQAVCARWPRCAAGLRVPRCVRKLTYSSVVSVSCSILCSACLWVPLRVSSSVFQLAEQREDTPTRLWTSPPDITIPFYHKHHQSKKKKSMPENINCIAYISGKSPRWLTQEADKGRGRLEKRRQLMLCNTTESHMLSQKSSSLSCGSFKELWPLCWDQIHGENKKTATAEIMES